MKNGSSQSNRKTSSGRAQDVLQKFKRVHYMNEKLAIKKKSKEMSATQKIEQLVENPDHAAIRLARNANT
jgi:hypothetical protein